MSKKEMKKVLANLLNAIRETEKIKPEHLKDYVESVCSIIALMKTL